ncbi:MAG: hypothetical protein QNJ77_14455 [Acidimicrobiia bacterium]|nr:hypothetical protein [Acidimicrobiia bacterium]
MRRGRLSAAEGSIGVASGRLRWTRDGDDLVTGRYQIRLQAPSEWELTYRGQLLEMNDRRSKALAWAEHHHRDRQRIRQITRWSVLAGVALVVATVAANHISELWGYPVFAAAVWVLLSSLARAQASVTRNLLDPYRTREGWESPDWWNRNP